MRGSARTTALAALLTCAVTGTGCSSSTSSKPGPVLNAPGQTSATTVSGGLTAQPLPVGTTFTLQAGELCTTGGPVTINSVQPVMAVGKMVVDTWGTRLQTNAQVGEPGDTNGDAVTLASIGHFTKAAFALPCNATNAHREFNIELHPTTAVAVAIGFLVHYGQGQTFHDLIAFGMCTKAMADAKKCPNPLQLAQKSS